MNSTSNRCSSINPRPSRKCRAARACCAAIDTLECRSMFAVGFSPYVLQTVEAGVGQRAVVTGDFNNDGKKDVLTGHGAGAIGVLLGSGNGTYQTPILRQGVADSNCIQTADLNVDGKLDLVILDNTTAQLSILYGNGNGTFGATTAYLVGAPGQAFAYWVAVGDLNNDGKPDIVTANASTGTVGILMNSGNGAFNTAKAYNGGPSPTRVAIADFNNDGKADLATATTNSVCIITGKGDGTFNAPASISATTTPTGIAIGDMNGDGKKDLAVLNGSTNAVSVMLGNGNATFQTATNYGVGVAPQHVLVGDIDNDGRADIVTENYTSSTVTVLAGNGNGTFQSALAFNTAPTPNQIAMTDLNGDGKLDIITTHAGTQFGISTLIFSNYPSLFGTSGGMTVNEGVTATNSGTFYGATGAAAITLTASLGTVTKNDAAGTWNWSYLAADNMFTTPVTITAREPGGLTSTFTFTLTANNVAPTMNTFVVPTAANEGAAVNLSASASDPAGTSDPLSYAWTLTRAGGFTASLAGAAPSISTLDNGTYTVALGVNDGDGGTATRSGTLVINNIAPTINATTIPATSTEGTAMTFSATATDPGGANDPLSYQWTFNLGTLGSFTRSGSNVSISAPDNCSMIVNLMVDDGDDGTASIPARTITVLNAPPVVTTLVVPTAANEGDLGHFTATAADPAGSNDVLTYNWSITDPLGAVSAYNNTGTFPLDFRLGDSGTYSASMTVRDEDGGSVVRTQTFAVNNLPPTATFQLLSTLVFANDTATQRFLMSATDPCAADLAAGFTYRINWGDGSSIQTIAQAAGNSELLVDHLYVNAGSYAVSMTAIDKDGGTNTATATVNAVIVESAFAFDAPQPAITVKYPVDIFPGSLHAGDLRVTNLSGGPSPYMPNDSVVSYNAATRTATWTFTRPLADANYHAWLPAVATLPSGVPVQQEINFDFFSLAGDANHDRTVDFADLAVLAQNYGKAGQKPSQGNVNYDAAGKVDFDDLVMLAQHYGATVPATAPGVSALGTPPVSAATLFGVAAIDLLVGDSIVTTSTLRDRDRLFH